MLLYTLIILLIGSVAASRYDEIGARMVSAGGLASVPNDSERLLMMLRAYSRQKKSLDMENQAIIKAMWYPGAVSHCMHYNEIALTFDDGPSEYTDYLLDVLADEDVKATFFVLGVQIDTNGHQQIKRMKNEGHSIGSHTYSHPDLTTLSDDEIEHQLKMTEDALEAAGGIRASNGLVNKKPSYFRPPYGALDDRVMRILNNNGYHHIVLWNIDSFDWRDRPNLADFYQTNLHSLHGPLTLQHDTYSETVYSVRDAIRVIKNHGYKFVSMSRCLFG